VPESDALEPLLLPGDFPGDAPAAADHALLRHGGDQRDPHLNALVDFGSIHRDNNRPDRQW
jgi:hypothetical protein